MTLDVIGLSWRTGGNEILRAASFSVPTGSTTAILGPSGSGKTTMLRLIAGLERPSKGDLRWDGDSVLSLPPHKREFGLMFQDYALFAHRSVASNVGFGLEMQGLAGPERLQRVEDALELVGLGGFQDRAVESLSGGEQQRVALARALAPRPRLLMFDEPLGSLDRALREHLVGEIRSILAENRITAIYVTHDQDEAFSVADDIVLLDAGTVTGQGSPEQLWNDPGSVWTARFLGFRNIIEVRGGRWGKLDLGDMRDGPAFIRRGSLHLDPFGDVPGTVRSAVFSAGHFLLEIETEDGLLELESDANPGVATPVRMSIDPGGVRQLSA